MLEVKNLTKIYKTRGTVQVKALDNVSVKFPDKGMVFLLGKSGSGKSTLLNLCGGLDSPSGGEIIVKGRSSAHFSQSDFDSYRNTFVGFIFQEYNILNEFTVEDNIALALELQGKSKDKKSIAELLEQVDLSGYAKRKPNTLSGGQKQRIAIARALIKAPEIIMADEPTGALDSNTGKQVFETLKKLSKDKLVIVVSHDRDFAEQYGDRIIELGDGKIISDESKKRETQEKISSNVTSIGDTLCINKGAELNDNDFSMIKEFLKKSDTDVVITTGEKNIKEFKKVSRITDKGEREVFKTTENDAIEMKDYTPEEAKFIRSKLPLRHAFKIGVSGLKSKPIRLLFTLLLCTVAFVLFGVFSTLLFYDGQAVLSETLIKSDTEFVMFGKEVQIKAIHYEHGEEVYSYTYESEGYFTEEEVKKLREEYNAEIIGTVEKNYSITTVENSNYWISNITSCGYLPKEHSLQSLLLHGSFPEADNEICISSYIAEGLVQKGLNDPNTGFELQLLSVSDLIGKKVSLNENIYIVSGIFKTEPLDSKYDTLKETQNPNYELLNNLHLELSNGLHMVAFFTQAQVKEIFDNVVTSNTGFKNSEKMIFIVDYNFEEEDYIIPDTIEYSNGTYTNYQVITDDIYLFKGDLSSLSNDQVLVSRERFLNHVSIFFDKKHTDIIDEYDKNNNDWEYLSMLDKKGLDSYMILDNWKNGQNIPQENDDLYEIYQSFMTEGGDLLKDLVYCRQILLLISCIRNGGVFDQEKGEFIPYTAEELKEYFSQIQEILKSNPPDLQIQFILFTYNKTQMTVGQFRTAEIVGFIDTNNYGITGVTPELCNELWTMQKGHMEFTTEETSKYTPHQDSTYTSLFVTYDHSKEMTKMIAAMDDSKFSEDDGTRITASSSVLDVMNLVNNFVKPATKVFFYIGIVFAVFAMLLLSNFITVSIAQKKRDIGVLRAVGARGRDVFKIFISESMVITSICVIISIILSNTVCQILNDILASGIGSRLFVFGLKSFVVLVGIAFVATIVATFLPVNNAARKKPVESIRAI